MTPFQSTPSIWVAFRNQEVANTLVERMEPFAHGKKLQDATVDLLKFMGEVSRFHLIWLLVDHDSSSDEALITMAKKAHEQNEFFRCAVVGAETPNIWPAGTIHMDSNSLSTAILDRLRNESQALRIANSRIRHMRRLQNR